MGVVLKGERKAERKEGMREEEERKEGGMKGRREEEGRDSPSPWGRGARLMADRQLMAGTVNSEL